MSASILFVRLVVTELQRRNVPVCTLLSGTGVDEVELSYMRARVTREQLERLLERALELTGDPALGLAVGRHAPSSSLQVLSYWMLSCRTLRLAFDAFLQHAPALADGLRWKLREDEELAYFSFEDTGYGADTARLFADAGLMMATRLVRQLSGADPRAVWFRHARVSYVAECQELFGCPLHFLQPRNALVFDRRLLDLPQTHGDQGAARLLREVAAQIFEPPPPSRESHEVTVRVRLLLREGGLSAPSLERIARRLGMSRRMLRRRLSDQGVTLTGLVDEARRDLACEALSRPRPQIRETARELGFSEPSAFHRAFKRWTGKTPLQFSRDRASLGQSRPDKACAAAG